MLPLAQGDALFLFLKKGFELPQSHLALTVD